mgnify:CR=1 FL=1
MPRGVGAGAELGDECKNKILRGALLTENFPTVIAEVVEVHVSGLECNDTVARALI